MANSNTTQVAGILSVPPTPQKVGDIGGRVRTLQGNFALTALPAGDTICIGKLPKGARLLPQSCIMVTTTQGTATLAVGSAPSQANGQLGGTITATKYGSARAYTTAADPLFLDQVANLGVEITAAYGEDIYITIGIAPATPGTLKTFLQYVVD
ncbi:hypothetical protein [Candidatus Accumulibacter vicinus]|uniref:Uncharacterized protein n=1 Tax=Candidatus Accumulibacter vicinus TaxID=2954382 RepID=A0A084XUA5_9PROT|nr:hypothetical protein [Candidatus Accumulibacter vicinus]KFB66049.1 MAG: hypothetical protein CAPSK01_004652 [Candidatus Accumulibacter vicinus]